VNQQAQSDDSIVHRFDNQKMCTAAGIFTNSNPHAIPTLLSVERKCGDESVKVYRKEPKTFKISNLRIMELPHVTAHGYGKLSYNQFRTSDQSLKT